MTQPSITASTAPTVVLQTAPGTGLLVRRAHALLFVPEPDERVEKLVAEFDAAPPGAEFDALAEAVLVSLFDLPAFVAVSFDGRTPPRLRAFGDLEVATDQASCPQVSAASSRTWVDHTVHDPTTEMSVDVSADQCSPYTDVREGSVTAGGFRLRLSEPSLAQPSPPRATVERQPAPAPDASDADQPKQADLLTLDPPPTVAPPRAELEFDDGQIVTLVGSTAFGRNPMAWAASQDIVPFVVTGEKVSRAHLAVRIEGDQVSVEDCGSRNGSAVITHAGAEPRRLIAGDPVAVEPGARVFLGSRSFTLHRPQETQ